MPKRNKQKYKKKFYALVGEDAYHELMKSVSFLKQFNHIKKMI
jgi:hypothetical protein